MSSLGAGEVAGEVLADSGGSECKLPLLLLATSLVDELLLDVADELSSIASSTHSSALPVSPALAPLLPRPAIPTLLLFAAE